jgi:hypothetical protein
VDAEASEKPSILHGIKTPKDDYNLGTLSLKVY